MLRVDKEATERAGFVDSRSYICLASFRIHPGTDHPCEYLFGPEDVGRRRAEIFFRDDYHCKMCGKFCTTETGTLDHVKGGLGAQRCWCPENLQLLCKDCHGKKTRESEHH